MPLDPSKIGSSTPRTVHVEGIGPVVVRRPVLADIRDAGANPYWWTRCCTLPDGGPLFAPGADVGQLDAEIAGVLLQEVNRPRPTHEPSADSGASVHPSRG